MSKPHPTALIYGMPKDPDGLLQSLTEKGIGIVIDNGHARDKIFTIYENLSRADLIIAYPNANPVHLKTLIAEGEVGHPLIVQEKTDIADGERHYNLKPIIFFGTDEEWQPFKDQFNGMRRAGLLRDGFDRVAHYTDSFQGVLDHVDERLVRSIDATRTKYWLHTKTPSDIDIEAKPNTRPPSDFTVSFFGSASIKHPDDIDPSDEKAIALSKAAYDRADSHALMCAKNNWNILHGGGNGGMMGQLSKSGNDYKAFVFGISVHMSGAPKIFFEKDPGANVLDDHDYFVNSKDMIHRIETYCLHSEAFCALDGGIGTLQEVLVIAELLSTQHPAVMNMREDGTLVPKPLFVQNEGRIFTEAIEYLEARGLTDLKDQIIVANSTREVDQHLQAYQREHGPFVRGEERESLRDQIYRNIEIPQFDLTDQLPRLIDELRTPQLPPEASQEVDRRSDMQP